jgi:hypothetical protein
MTDSLRSSNKLKGSIMLNQKEDSEQPNEDRTMK